VPLKRLDGFDAVLASLKRLVAAPERISWWRTTQDGASPDGGHSLALSPRAVHFDPP
jgi:hypothetical protein